MFPAIYQLLLTPDVAAILGDRLYGHGGAPQGTTAPYAVWSVVNDEPSVNLSSAPGSDRFTINVDLYSDTDDGIEQLTGAVRDAIESFSTVTGMPLDGQEPETGLYRVALQFDYWSMR